MTLDKLGVKEVKADILVIGSEAAGAKAGQSGG